MALQNIDLFLSLYVLLLGLLVGSYLNVVIHRLPRGISTTLPRSRCPRCLTPIKPWDNVPVLSWFVLRGRCRACRMCIAWRYPAIEALNGLLFLAAFHRFRDHGAAAVLVAMVFCSAMLALAMIDFEHYLLPDVITLPGIVLGLALQPWWPRTTLQEAVLGALVGGGVLFAAAWIWFVWKGVLGMGMGDVKMLAMVGAFLGWRGVIATLFLASLAGSAVGIALMARGRLHLQSKLPFGVFLSIAAVATLFYGDEFALGYEHFGYVFYRWIFGIFGAV